MTNKISCTITRYYGAETVSFGAEIEIDGVMTDETRKITYQRLYQKINDVHTHYTAQLLPQVPNTRTAAKPAETEVETIETMPAIRISVSMKDGKLYYNLHGGKYTKHGVRIWEETLIDAHIGDIPNEGKMLQGYTARIVVKGGHPQKVISLDKKS